jgi:acetyl-CoA C-acetyltransferase
MPVDTTPIIIGVGQVSERPQDGGYRGLSPMDLGGMALASAIADCTGTGSVAQAIDTVAAIRQFEISTPFATAPFGRSNNPPRSIAARVGAAPARAILEITGGQGPQTLVGELAAEIASGRSHVAAIVGAEAISTALALGKAGQAPDWSEDVGGDIEDRGFGLDGMLDPALIRHGVAGMIPNYALFENARRARLGYSLEQYRQAIGDLFSPFCSVAAANPHAASREHHDAAALATISERNRIVAEPYTRLTVSRDQVNQGAAILLASVDAARQLGVPEDRWVYIHAVTSADELSPLTRPDLSCSPAAIESVRAALARAETSFGAVSHVDLYSCFAIAVFNQLDAFGLSVDDPRGWTLTGGLPFFGGAGNNYSSHAVAEAVLRSRAAPGSLALVGANGGALSKYATGIYSTTPADWRGGERYAKLPRQQTACPVAESVEGAARIESYTMMTGKSGPVAPLVLRTDNGARQVALADLDDPRTSGLIGGGMPFGSVVKLRTDDRGRNIAQLA